jgi:hypothetical protein
MNFIFISPQFPETYWNWCDRLKRNGVNVLGIGDTPYDNIPEQLKAVLTEYYWTPSLEDYDQVFRAVAFFSFKYGKIDWIESNNEYWLPLDARLRDDFNVRTGAGSEQVSIWQSKAGMKPLYAAGDVPTARQVRVAGKADAKAARAFAKKVGYPLFAKPEKGVGSGGAHAVANASELKAFLDGLGDDPYVLEEFVTGDICSYDAILDSNGDPLFENQEEFPPSMEEVVRLQLDVSYFARPSVDPALQKLGRAAAKSFGLKSRFVHMEFFRLTEDKPGLGKAGDYVGLEVNVRPPGGFTPDILNFAHSTDVYRIWADMVCFDERRLPESDDQGFCVYASRRDIYTYAHSDEEVRAKYGDAIRMSGRMADALSDDLGNSFYMGRFSTEEELHAFVDFVQEQA